MKRLLMILSSLMMMGTYSLYADQTIYTPIPFVLKSVNYDSKLLLYDGSYNYALYYERVKKINHVAPAAGTTNMGTYTNQIHRYDSNPPYIDSLTTGTFFGPYSDPFDPIIPVYMVTTNVMVLKPPAANPPPTVTQISDPAIICGYWEGYDNLAVVERFGTTVTDDAAFNARYPTSLTRYGWEEQGIEILAYCPAGLINPRAYLRSDVILYSLTNTNLPPTHVTNAFYSSINVSSGNWFTKVVPVPTEGRYYYNWNLTIWSDKPQE